VLLAALVDRGRGLVEVELAEVHGEMTRVVLDRRDVVDRLAEAAVLGIGEPLERLPLDVDEVGDVEDLVQAREAAARPGGVNTRQDSDSSGGRRRAKQAEGACGEARPSKIAQANVAPAGGRSALTDPVRGGRVCGAAP